MKWLTSLLPSASRNRDSGAEARAQTAERGSRRHVYSRGGGIGDELIAVCAIQAATRRRGDLDIAYHTRYRWLFEGVTGPGAVFTFDEKHLRESGTGLTYAHKQALPIVRQMTAQLGVPEADDFTVNLPVRSVPLPAQWPGGDQPRILVQISASDWTPNKQWPLSHWTSLIESLPEDFSIIEVGSRPALDAAPRHRGWLSLAGRTSLEEFVSCVRSATAFIGPVSSGMASWRAPSAMRPSSRSTR